VTWFHRRAAPRSAWRWLAAAFFLATACFVSSLRWGLSPHAGEVSAQAMSVVFGRVLSSPGMASPDMPKPSGVPGTTVTISDAASGKAVASATTGNDGGFRFTVPPGDYSVKGPGNPHLVHVEPGQQFEVHLYLPNP
jgi:hypothetical protein